MLWLNCPMCVCSLGLLWRRRRVWVGVNEGGGWWVWVEGGSHILVELLYVSLFPRVVVKGGGWYSRSG